MRGPPPRRQTLLILWGALTMSVVMYAVVGRVLTGHPRPKLHDPQTGALSYLVFVLPVVVLALGYSLFRAVALAGRGSDGRSRSWQQLTTGSIMMLAVFEVNALVGLVLLVLGGPFAKLVPFVAESLVLNLFGLTQILRAQPLPHPE